MQGLTVDKVEVGSRRDIEGVHHSELLISPFADGSIMSVDTRLQCERSADGEQSRPISTSAFSSSGSRRMVSSTCQLSLGRPKPTTQLIRLYGCRGGP